jgi:hypothetical protein
VTTDEFLVPFGKLVGVEEINQSIVVPDVTTNANGKQPLPAQTLELGNAIAVAKSNVQINKHFGGGLLGSQVFILKNSNLTPTDVAGGPTNDPESVVARRISKRIFEDLLCQQMPTLSEEDVMGEVLPNSPHGFRQSTSCMSCHSSMDPMANAYRNFIEYRKIAVANTNSISYIGLNQLSINPSSSVFALQTPTATLKYRDHKNILVNKPVTGLVGLGLELSQSDDFYRCIVKKYYEFFTGYNINLAPRNIPEAANTKQIQFHRNKIYSLAEQLKSHQSLMQMIDGILKSEAFIYREYKAP